MIKLPWKSRQGTAVRGGLRAFAVASGLVVGCLARTASAEFGCPANIAADLSGLVDQIAAVPEASWFRANQNQFRDVWSPLDLRPKPDGLKAEPSSLIKAWSSFAWDCRRGDLLLFGGGHANYAGNDTYRWRATTRRWERMSLPSEVVQNELLNWTAIDGAFAAPIAAHTYDNNIYLPAIDRFLVFGGSAWNNGGAFTFQTGPGTQRKTGPYTFDLSRADGSKVGGTTGSHVQRIAPHPEVVGGEMWQNRDHYEFMAPEVLPENFISGATAYATPVPGKDVVYVSARVGGSAQTLYRYEFTDADDAYADTIALVGRTDVVSPGRGSGTYDPHLNIFVRTAVGTKWSGSSSFYYWNLNTPGPLNKLVTFVPLDLSGGWTLNRGYGLDYDPVRRQYMLWAGANELWVLRGPLEIGPQGWTIKRAPIANNTIPPVDAGDGGGGVLGKWKYIPELDAFMGLADPSAGNIWIYKPVGWQRPGSPRAPVVQLTAEPYFVGPGETSVLAWQAFDAASCTASGSWSGARATAGTQVVGPLTGNARFELRCQGPGGEGLAEVAVGLEVPAPTIGVIAQDSCVNGAEAAAGVTLSGQALPNAGVSAELGSLNRSVTATAAGVWSAVFSTAELAGVPDGQVTVRARQQDLAGNYSDYRVVTIQKDTESPAETLSGAVLDPASDTGLSSTDGVTRDVTPTYFGSASEPDVKVAVFAEGIERIRVSAGSNGAWRATIPSLSNGVYHVHAAVADACGNLGQPTPTATVTIDTGLPALTVGTVAGDNRINAVEAAASVTVSGTSEVDAAIAVSATIGQSPPITRNTTSNGAWSVALVDIASLPDGSLSVKTTASDTAGNLRGVTRVVVKDTVVAPPSLAPVTGDDVITASERSAIILFTGATEPYATINLVVNGWSRSINATSAGTWSIGMPTTVSSTLPIGSLGVRVWAKDAAGNVSADTVRSITIQ